MVTIESLVIYSGMGQKDLPSGIREGVIPINVCDKLRRHVDIGNDIAKKLGIKIRASQKSGYRPVEWEKWKGRTGTSQHCFKGLGAVDWACDHSHMDRMIEMLRQTYARVAWYPKKGFVHVDDKQFARPGYFICFDGVSWIRQ